MRSEDIRNWLIILIAWPMVLFAMPWQDPLIQLVGLRGSVFLLPFVLLGARLTGDDVYKLALWFSVLNLGAGALAIAEYTSASSSSFRATPSPTSSTAARIWRTTPPIASRRHSATRIPTRRRWS